MQSVGTRITLTSEITTRTKGRDGRACCEEGESELENEMDSSSLQSFRMAALCQIDD